MRKVNREKGYLSTKSVHLSPKRTGTSYTLCSKSKMAAANLVLLLVPYPRGEKINHLTVWCEFMSYCRQLVRLDVQLVLKKIVSPDGQISDDLFVPFAHQTIGSSETIGSSSSVKTSNDWLDRLSKWTIVTKPRRHICNYVMVVFLGWPDFVWTVFSDLQLKVRTSTPN